MSRVPWSGLGYAPVVGKLLSTRSRKVGCLAVVAAGIAIPCLLLVYATLQFGGSGVLENDDCRTHSLQRVESCLGEDRGFQECQFFFRAKGEPKQNWCPAIRDAAGTNSETCSRDAFREVACIDYGLPPEMTCHRCDLSEFEANRTYVYAYDRACRRGIEQVTCNFDQTSVPAEIRELKRGR